MAPYTELNSASDLVADYSSIIKGKTILTTGVTPGSVGAAYVEAVAAASPALLILVGRSPEKLEKEAAIIKEQHPDVPVRSVVADLMSLESVRKAAGEINSWSDVPSIDVVHNCAGIMATPYALSKEGYESQFASNHIAHFLLTNLIMDKILASEAPRVINVTSDGHRLGHVRWGDINFDGGNTYDKWTAYGQSKTANMLMAISLAEKLATRGLLAFSVHPGLIMTTGLGSHLDFSGKPNDDLQGLLAADRRQGNAVGFAADMSGVVMLTAAQGASTSVYASFEPSLKGKSAASKNDESSRYLTVFEASNGQYLQKNRLADPFTDTVKPWATSPVEARLLWTLSEKMVGQEFKY